MRISDVFEAQLTLAISRLWLSAFAANTSAGAQNRMFSAAGIQRFMGRWSRDLAPLLVNLPGFAAAMLCWTSDRELGLRQSW
jgi:hypothetical protein